MSIADDDLPPAIPPRAHVKRDAFLDLVAARCATPREGVDPVADATLATLAEVLATGQSLTIPPLGQVRVIKEKSGRAGHQLLLRLTLDAPAPAAEATAPAAPDEGLAPQGD